MGSVESSLLYWTSLTKQKLKTNDFRTVTSGHTGRSRNPAMLADLLDD